MHVCMRPVQSKVEFFCWPRIFKMKVKVKLIVTLIGVWNVFSAFDLSPGGAVSSRNSHAQELFVGFTITVTRNPKRYPSSLRPRKKFRAGHAYFEN